jgi:GT2 family glycosyltransferase
MVAHEPGDWFTESLRGLSQQTYESLQALVLVTGEESDPSARAILDTIATELPAAVVRFLGGNPGFAASCNSVLNLVQGDSGFFCFMHDDVALAPDAISLLVEELYRSNAGAVGPKLTYWDNPKMIQSVGVDVDRFGVELPIADDGELDQEQHDAVRDVFKLSSACMLVRADLFRTVKGLSLIHI